MVVALLSGPIVRSEIGVAPGFSSVQQDVVINLMRLNLIATLIFSISGLVTAGLQANQHFLLPALAPMLYNVGQIFGALVLSPRQPYVAGRHSNLPAMGSGSKRPGLRGDHWGSAAFEHSDPRIDQVRIPLDP